MTIFLILAIISKKNITYKEKINYHLYQEHLSFSYFNNLYNHYLKGILPLEKTKATKAVFHEKLNYKKITPYLDGVQLEVNKNYLVPNQEAGVVVYVGKKENYGNVVIIEGLNNIDTWYGNLCNIPVKLYDYIEQGKYLGETCNEVLYLAYEKDNTFLKYEDYLT